MKIAHKSLAVFWRLPGKPVQQFHADMIPMEGENVADVVARFRGMFPGDIVCSVRDSRGRFVAFKPARVPDLTSAPAFVLIIRAIWERGANQVAALAAMRARGLWLSPDQKQQAGLSS